MKRLPMLILAALALPIVAADVRAAVPATLSFAGRLSTASGPVNGNAAVSFSIFADQVDPTPPAPALWTETHPTLVADQGLVFAELGSLVPFGAAFDGDEAWLEISVNGEKLTPRVKLLAVPYALKAATAETLGSLGEADVQKKLTAGNGIALNGQTVSLSTAGCSTGQVLKFTGSTWSCANPPGFTSCTWRVVTQTTQNPVAVCPANKVAISGGCKAATIGIRLINSLPSSNPPDGATSAPGWECLFDTSATNVAYAYCCNVN